MLNEKVAKQLRDKYVLVKADLDSLEEGVKAVERGRYFPEAPQLRRDIEEVREGLKEMKAFAMANKPVRKLKV